MYTLSITVQDGILPKPHKSTVQINFTGAAVATWNATQLQAVADATLPIVDDLITGKIVGAGWTFTPTIVSGLRAEADENSDVEEGALFIFQSVYPYKTRVRIPTFNETFMLPASKQVDLTATEVIAFTDLMVDGLIISLVGFDPSDSRAVAITSLVSAVDAFQKDRG